MSQMKNRKNKLKLDLDLIKNPSKKLKSSTNLTLKSKGTMMTTSTSLNTKNSELNEVDLLIQRTNFRKKGYSKSLVNPYIPLTRFEKVKELTEMDETSTNRLKRYSSIFEQIKREIYDINNMGCKTKPKNIEGYIEEREEEDFTSPKYINKNNKISFDCDDQVDEETLNENIKQITLSNSKENESMRSTRIRNKNRKIMIKYSTAKAVDNKHNYQTFTNVNKQKKEKVYDKAIALDKEERSAKMSTNSCNCLIQ